MKPNFARRFSGGARVAAAPRGLTAVGQPERMGPYRPVFRLHAPSLAVTGIAIGCGGLPGRQGDPRPRYIPAP